MGDRGNLVVVQHRYDQATKQVVPSGALFFYSHWGGYDLPRRLQRGLREGQDRWTDTSYLARILFCAVLSVGIQDLVELLQEPRSSDPKHQELTDLMVHLRGTTGYGISTSLSDNEYDLLVVDTATQRVYRVPEAASRQLEQGTLPLSPDTRYPSWSFEEYLTLDMGEQGAWEAIGGNGD